jgi:CBS domain-containing protein
MTVEQILGTKGNAVVTIQPDRTIAEAARQLAEKRIGAIVVSQPNDPVLGIISERDIVRALARSGAAALEDQVERHMTAEVVTCTRAAAIDELMEIMTVQKFRHIPVVEDGRLIGIVSIGDIVKQRVAEIEAEQQALREYIATA